MNAKLKIFTLLGLLFSISFSIKAQLPERVLVGYWHNWNTQSVPFIPLKDVDDRYNVICISFAYAENGNINTLDFSIGGWLYSDAAFKNEVLAKRAEGKRVLISVGGANGSFRLESDAEKDVFVSRMKTIIDEYKFDGIDIDLEQQSYLCMNSGTMQNPESHIQRVIDGVQELLDWYQVEYGKKMILTTAPETFYVQGGSTSQSCTGAYLPFLVQLKDEIDLLMVQLYNSDVMNDLNQTQQTQGTADFIVSQTEKVILGFNSGRGWGNFPGFPASKVTVSLPACESAAGGGYIEPDVVVESVKYLMKKGGRPGNYRLLDSDGHEGLRGLMTWSINHDARTACGGGAYTYADAFEEIFGEIELVNTNEVAENIFKVYPNPTSDLLIIEHSDFNDNIFFIYDLFGNLVQTGNLNNTRTNISLSNWSAGIYTIIIGGKAQKIIVQ